MKTLFGSGKKLKIKICGLTLKEDISTCSQAGIDAVGFLVKEIKPATETDILLEREAQELISHIPHDLKSVLLLKYTDMDRIINLIGNTRPDVIQIQKEADGIEIAKTLRALFPNMEIIKTFYTTKEMTRESLCCMVDEYAPYIDAVNQDAAQGGAGKKHDWDMSATICTYVKTKGLSYVLAGGVNAENLEEAYRQVKPDMIDIMSGARQDGKLSAKDSEKIEQIMKVANQINKNYEF